MLWMGSLGSIAWESDAPGVSSLPGASESLGQGLPAQQGHSDEERPGLYLRLKPGPVGNRTEARRMGTARWFMSLLLFQASACV